MIYKFKFNKNPIRYYFKYILYFLATIVILLLCLYISDNIKLNGIPSLVIKLAIFAVTINIIYITIFSKSTYFKDIIEKTKRILLRKE